MSRRILLVSCGDPNGIGPEIAVKAIKKASDRIKKNSLLVGPEDVLKKSGWNSNLCAVLNVSCEKFTLKPGRVDAKAGLISFKAFSLACRLASEGFGSAVVSAPVSKEAWLLAGLPYMGHTCYLKKAFKVEPVMSFHYGNFNSFLITEHLPIEKVPASITEKKIISKVKSFAFSFGLARKAKILMSGLNPHCGENGALGKEEILSIGKAILKLRRSGFEVCGPLNSEDIFSRYFSVKADAAVFMYHDQLLSPLKIIYKHPVHATWGLPFVRTSATHGTAFDIAWKNRADSLGMLAAMEFAFKKVSG
ncbi:MAG: 4-hydroxythreonine-4-phosphate dehydrogenase PdxA [Elusimicrobiota bacterium]